MIRRHGVLVARLKRLGHALGLGSLLGLACGCSLPLAEIKVRSPDRAVAQVRRAGQAWGCRELPSEQFRVYLICPDPKFTLGVMEREGNLAFACPDHTPSQCEKLARRLLYVGCDDCQEVAPWP
jgi:hypothetical protein